MKNRSKYFVFGFLLFALASPAFSAFQGINGGGEVAPSDPISKQTVEVDLGDGSCSGTLIDRNWVVTAGHCIIHEGRRARSVNIIFEANSGRAVLRSAKLYVHPQYEREEQGGDIALVYLDRAAPSDYVPVPMADRDPPSGTTVVVAGFGQRNGGQADGLYKTTLKTQNSREQDSIQWQQSTRNGVCYGDSGGSAYDASGHTLYGVISHGDGACTGTTFATSVAYFRSWISQVMGGKGQNPSDDGDGQRRPPRDDGRRPVPPPEEGDDERDPPGEGDDEYPPEEGGDDDGYPDDEGGDDDDEG